MNIKEMKEMIQLMNENNLTEIELEKDGLKVRLKKGSSGSVEQQIVYHERPAPRLHEAAPEAAKPAAAASKAVMVKSPMVGTYYSAPAPDAPPFLQVGSQVEVGQVICIIEAMKLMNEIKSEIRGKVAELLVNNGDPVEFGQPLFRVE
jgi:acetyl-CoA carboxylase biotin carboxyl carrier protein